LPQCVEVLQDSFEKYQILRERFSEIVWMPPKMVRPALPCGCGEFLFDTAQTQSHPEIPTAANTGAENGLRER
jgi:hypothetical protein